LAKSKIGRSNKVEDKIVMFVFIENAERSEIAEGFFKKYAPTGFKVQSAGTKPVSQKIC
jgi:protein-tyrosine-phosphatase